MSKKNMLWALMLATGLAACKEKVEKDALTLQMEELSALPSEEVVAFMENLKPQEKEYAKRIAKEMGLAIEDTAQDPTPR